MQAKHISSVKHSLVMCCVRQVRRPGGAGKGVSPALAALVEPGAPGRHLPLDASSPEAEAKDPDLAALLKKARARFLYRARGT